jgi:pimeloyl-ACP methyl ester carboxylesterase
VWANPGPATLRVTVDGVRQDAGGKGRGRRTATALVALGALGLGACAPAPGRGAQHRSTAPTSPPAGSLATTTRPPTTTTTVPTPPVTPVQWASCGALVCGSVAAPLDYGQPQLGTIQIALAMHPATDPAQRIGSLVINPGGPGGSGVNDLPAELSVLTPQLLARFDIVSFDPRGVQRSSPVLCSSASSGNAGSSSSSTPGPLPDPVPGNPGVQLALVTNDEAYASQCESMSGKLLPFVGTVDTARDLDRIRQALGDAQLTFFGHSYGTLLGATYADMFPTHVRAMVLDGAIDPAMSTAQMVTEQGSSFEAVLDDFFSWCTSSGCPWRPPGGPSATALLALIDQSRLHRIPAGGGRSAGPGELYYALLAGLYARSAWPTLGNALAQAASGNGAAVVSMEVSYTTGGSTNAADAETAIDCLDHPVVGGVTGLRTLAAQAAAAAPVFGPLLAWGEAACAVWPVPATRPPQATTAVGSPPILVVGATRDPATPYAWAQRLASELQHGLLVTWQGENHVAYYYSACVRAIDQAYLVEGSLPAAGAACSD